jgi:predicted amidohydrolase
MQNFKIAVAQVPSVKGNITENIKTHLSAIKQAAELGVTYIVFPELSLTGYEPELAADLVFTNDDNRLQSLIDCAKKHKITVAVGAPLVANSLPKIGLLIISPLGHVNRYEKMHLHPGEDIYFSSGDKQCVLSVDRQKIANAICADTNNKAHVQACVSLGATVYIAGVLISDSGYNTDSAKLAHYAEKYNLLVAMANHNQPTGQWQPIGKSAVFYRKRVLACANEHQNALVVAECVDGDWTGKVYAIAS